MRTLATVLLTLTTAAVVVAAFVAGWPAPAPPAPLRYYTADTGRDTYRVQADETRTEGLCTVFYRGGQRIAGVCGYHVWSEAVEVE